MTQEQLLQRLRSTLDAPLPLPGAGQTAIRHERLMEIGRENLSLARLAEAHWDAVAILSEAGRAPVTGSLYGVWASEIFGQSVEIERGKEGLTIHGAKLFCSGAGLIDRALVTTGMPTPLLVDLDLRANSHAIEFDDSIWKTTAFQETRTSKGVFHQARVAKSDIVGKPGWYLARPGFWHGACGPAACWAGGAAGLVDYAMRQTRADSHTLAHLGAMHAAIWMLRSCLEAAADEIDAEPFNSSSACIRALTVRHVVENACTEILRRLLRAYGPHPLVADSAVSRRYQELDLYLRQSHAERDLESLGRNLREQRQAAKRT